MSERPKTWSDVEREAINDPLISAAVMFVRAGMMTREDALCAAVIGLAEVNRQLTDDNVKAARRTAAGPSLAVIE